MARKKSDRQVNNKQLSLFDLNWRKGKVFLLTAQCFGWDFCINKECGLLVHYPNEERLPELFKLKTIEDCKLLASQLFNDLSL